MKNLRELEGARRKLIRADHHLHALWRELKVFTQSEVYSLRSETNLDRPSEPFIRCNYFVQTLKPVPTGWAVIIGDALGNLRSALDHAAWALVVRSKGIDFAEEHRRKIYFPIRDTPAWFSRDFVVTNVGPDAVDALRPSQPYVHWQDDPHRDSLWALNELTNIDKHRDLHIAVYVGRQTEIITDPAVPGGKVQFIDDGPLYEHAKVATFSGLRPDGPKVKVNCVITSEVAIEQTTSSPYVPLGLGLLDLRKRVREALHALKPILAREDRPLEIGGG